MVGWTTYAMLGGMGNNEIPLTMQRWGEHGLVSPSENHLGRLEEERATHLGSDDRVTLLEDSNRLPFRFNPGRKPLCASANVVTSNSKTSYIVGTWLAGRSDNSLRGDWSQRRGERLDALP